MSFEVSAQNVSLSLGASSYDDERTDALNKHQESPPHSKLPVTDNHCSQLKGIKFSLRQLFS